MSRIGWGSRRRALPVSLLAGLVALLVGVLPWAALAADPPPATGPQDIPLRLDRIFAADNVKLDIDGLDDERVDVDVAILDSGIKLDHPDVNIAGRTNCTAATWPNYQCTNASPNDGNDNEAGLWHGTSTAMGVGALDNNIGTVGVAPGARLWAVDILGDDVWDPVDPGFGPMEARLETVIAGVKWVTAHADQIEVAQIAWTCAPDQEDPLPQPTCLSHSPGVSVEDLMDELDEALEESIDAGVVYTIGSGNSDLNTNTVIPQGSVGDMLITGGMGDSDGKPGGLGPAACWARPDDTSSGTNWGPAVDLTAPGCAASQATPQVAAAAAILASRDNPNNRADVQEIGDTIIDAGNSNWTDTSGDGIKEKLLDLSDDDTFNPVITAGPSGNGGWDLDLKTRCAKTTWPQSANYYEDTTQCGAGSGRWTPIVLAENANPQGGCPGPANQAFPINGTGSPATLGWFPHSSPLGPNWTLRVNVDNVNTSAPCLGPNSTTQLAFLDHIGAGGGPLPNPRSLISSHEMSYSEWRPSGGETSLVAGAIFDWGGKTHRLEINLNSGGIADAHAHAHVLRIDSLGPTIERVILDGPALGLSVPSNNTTTFHWIDWKSLVKEASDQGWFSPMTTNAQTLGVHIGVKVKGEAIADLWTTNFRIAGKS